MERKIFETKEGIPLLKKELDCVRFESIQEPGVELKVSNCCLDLCALFLQYQMQLQAKNLGIHGLCKSPFLHLMHGGHGLLKVLQKVQSTNSLKPRYRRQRMRADAAFAVISGDSR